VILFATNTITRNYEHIAPLHSLRMGRHISGILLFLMLVVIISLTNIGGFLKFESRVSSLKLRVSSLRIDFLSLKLRVSSIKTRVSSLKLRSSILLNNTVRYTQRLF